MDGDGARVGVKVVRVGRMGHGWGEKAKWDQGQGGQDQGQQGDTARVSMTGPGVKWPGSGWTGPGSDGWAQDEAEHQRWMSSASALCLGAKGRLTVSSWVDHRICGQWNTLRTRWAG